MMWKGFELKWERTYIMGIINMSPDSFSGDGLSSPEEALKKAREMVKEGADIIDVGGESTRPGAEPISPDEELERIIPAIRLLARELGVPISVDTYKSEVALEALKAGASMINDVWGLKKDERLAELAASFGVPIILTENHREETFTNFLPELIESLRHSVEKAEGYGVPPSMIIIDPGIGFGKTHEQNLEIIRRLREIKEALKKPILIGPSRKSFIGHVLNLPPGERLEGTAAAVAIGIINGADIVRVHDVREMKRVAKVSDAIRGVPLSRL